MFTGIIEEIGIIKSIRRNGGGIGITVSAKKIFDDLKIDDSVSINGVCQTVVKISNNVFEVEAVEETMKKTNFKKLNTNSRVNLERALRLSDRLGGHIVQGHADTTGKVTKIENKQMSTLFQISFSEQFKKYIVPVGSICINGVSLTVAEVKNNIFMVSVIPHTIKNTTLSELKIGDEVNLEFDILGKYVENMLKTDLNHSSKSGLNTFIDQPDF